MIEDDPRPNNEEAVEAVCAVGRGGSQSVEAIPRCAGVTGSSAESEHSYRITPLGVMALHLPVELARTVMAALEDRARRYEGDGEPGMVFNGGGATFVKLQHAPSKPPNDGEERRDG